MQRFWIYEGLYLRGPFRVDELAQMENFSETLKVCEVGDDQWLPVSKVPAFRPYIKIISTGDYSSS
jgi:hypothetical protein